MVRLFTTPACPYCHSLKEFFKDKNIEFKEVDVASDEEGRKEMVEKSGQLGAPVVEINGEYIVGFDRGKIVKALKIQD